MRTPMLIVLCLALMSISLTSAQQADLPTSKPIICDRAERIFDVLRNEYKEFPIWHGESKMEDNTNYVLFYSDTSWTMVQFGKGIACVVGTGEKSRALPRGTMV